MAGQRRQTKAQTEVTYSPVARIWMRLGPCYEAGVEHNGSPVTLLEMGSDGNGRLTTEDGEVTALAGSRIEDHQVEIPEEEAEAGEEQDED